MLLQLNEPLLEGITTSWLDKVGVKLALLRLDKVDPLVSGNKSYKLAGYLKQAKSQDQSGLISLGGAHSNHLHALAAAGRRLGLRTVGLLRGEAHYTPTVSDLLKWGMELHWLGYGGYRMRHQEDFWQAWLERYPNYLAIPEGGGGWLGMQGCIPLIGFLQSQLDQIGWVDYDELWVAAGTGTTMAGLVMGEQGQHPVVGTLAVPSNYGVQEQVGQWLSEAGLNNGAFRWIDASLGGFARLSVDLACFIRSFELETGVLLEPVYTAKMLLALRNAVEAGHIPSGRRIVAIHTGGLQGRRALQASLDNLLKV
jgi:1-aminocyclopropane-1-carboxylate deaminase